MTKTCGNCGHAALDDQAQFCNRCGAPVPEERKPGFPICPGCGAVVSDELAQFCNRCGSRILPVQVVCSNCGSPAIDDRSRFCTRCGTTFGPKPVSRSINCPSCGAPDPQGQSLFCNRCGAPFNRPGTQAAQHRGHVPVIVSVKKHAEYHPTLTVPDSDWEPWNDVPSAPAPSGSPVPAIPGSAHHDQQIDIPQKRYAHLPLVADEMRKKSDTGALRFPADTPGASHRKKAGAQKKGVLGFLKK